MDQVMTLFELLPAEPDADSLYDAFTGWTAEQGLTLYPAQSEALIELVTGANVIVATPTGSGKSLIAVAAHFAALADGRRSFYTAPTKALVSEKFFALCATFGAERVGMATGDASVNPTAPIICATAEVLANQALREGSAAEIGQVVMDEFHFYADPDRGWAWQVPLLELPQAQFVLMSATLGDMSVLAEDLAKRTGRPTAVVAHTERPVPLSYRYAITPLHETLAGLLEADQAPVYVVHFTQAAAAEQALALMSVNVSSREEKDAIAEALGDFRFRSAFGTTLSRLIRHGIGVHHAGMLPRYRRLVETLAQGGLLKVICGTDTLGVGINVPIRSVLLTALSKYDGTKNRHLSAREFHQIAGRAGRAGFDTAGTVVVQAPEHVILTERKVAKAAADGKKKRKVVRKEPPPGFVSWRQPTFQRLIDSDPEPLTSQLKITHSMLLNLLARPGDARTALARMVDASHESDAAKLAHLAEAEAIFDGLLAAGIAEPIDPPDVNGRTLALTVELPRDFALNQPLSAFALAAFELLDPASPDYPLDVLSVIEATLDNPRQVLAAQRNAARGEAVAEMKAAGIEYDERMELLEKITYPQPLVELLEPALEIYAGGHPWVRDYELAPKSVARTMFEQAMTFNDFIGANGLARAEGVVLRYLAGAHKALRGTVPAAVRTEDVEDLTAWLGELVRQVDSSLLDEWEALVDPSGAAPDVSTLLDEPPPVTKNRRAFRVLVRNALFRRVELAARRRYGELGVLDPELGAEAWADAINGYFEQHSELPTGANARGPQLLIVDERPAIWQVRQIFDDPAGDHDWGFSAVVDLAASDEAGVAMITVTNAGEFNGVMDAD
jgi:superfamily II DNA/RNA helicase